MRLAMRVADKLKSLFTPIEVQCAPLDERRGVCPICDGYHGGVKGTFCANCLDQLEFTYSWLSPFRCKNEEMALFEHVLPLCYYGGGVIRQSIFQFKYHEQFPIGEAYAHLLGANLRAGGWAESFDAIVPVPLHWRKLLLRGYNQTELLAATLGEELSLPVAPVLRRVKHGHSQTRVAERNANVQGSFRLVRDAAARYAGQRLLLFDDVLTSGATSLACAACLREIPSVHLSFASIAVRHSIQKAQKDESGIEER